jgi:hypothetical protein
MLAKREAKVHLALYRAHSIIYAKTLQEEGMLNDDQMPQLVRPDKEDRTPAVCTKTPALLLQDDCNTTASLPRPPTSAHDYLSRNMKNLCMVYEEPLRTFYSHNKNDKLDKLGCLSYTRWRHIQKIHCVFPNETGQILGAKSLDATRYQSFYADFLEAIDGYKGEIESIVYLPGANKTTDDFLLVMNQFSPNERERLMGLIWPLGRTFYTWKAKSGQMMDIPTPLPSQPRPKKCSLLYRCLLIHHKNEFH